MERDGRRRSLTAGLGGILAMVLLLALCVPAAAANEGTADEVSTDEATLTLLTHDSFVLSDAAIEAFQDEHRVRLEVLRVGDAGSMVNQAILTRERPLADVLYGIDNTFLSRALDADLFEPYEAPALTAVPAELQLDPQHRVTPIDHADVCLNIDRAAFAEGALPMPATLEDLTDPALSGALVVEDPATSSPGLAFLLATVAYFGEDPDTGWRSYWEALRANDVTIESGWEEAYYDSFSGGSGAGRKPIVVSYATSPAAEVMYGPDPDADESPTAAIDAGCFRQVEFAGILAGSDRPDLAAAFIDHLLAPETQAELPTSMLVYPARADVPLPDVFVSHALVPTEPLSLDPAAIDAGRERWIREWIDTVLR